MGGFGRCRSAVRPLIREEGFLTAEEMTRLRFRRVPLLSMGMDMVGLVGSCACDASDWGEMSLCSMSRRETVCDCIGLVSTAHGRVLKFCLVVSSRWVSKRKMRRAV